MRSVHGPSQREGGNGTRDAHPCEDHSEQAGHRRVEARSGAGPAQAAAVRPGDPEFPQRVLTAYEYRCAVCGYDVRLGNRELGLGAAHIKRHEAGGPDSEVNGLALCALHHK